MLIYSNHITPRITYIFSLLLKNMLSEIVEFTSDEPYFNNYSKSKISYDTVIHQNCINIVSSGILHVNTLETIIPQVISVENIPVLFPQEEGNLPFDVAAAAFYLVSRYEEYMPFTSDVHDRFMASESIAAKNNFLAFPVVDIWAQLLLKHIVKKYPDIELKSREFTFISTIDVDNAFAYAGKGLTRTLGGLAKDILGFKFKNFALRMATLFGKKDPFNNYSFHNSLIDKYKFTTIYFWLFASFSSHDRSSPPTNKQFKAVIKEVSEKVAVGIHPSYQSNSNFDILRKEVKQLSETINKPIKISRQHYLKIRFPQTYNDLIKLGVKNDYSMGYADAIGFRAGTSLPFKFFDLIKDCTTELTIHPFSFMDVCIIDAQKGSPEDGIKTICQLIDQIKKVNGTFISVWHNRTFSERQKEWKGWNHVYELMLQNAME